MLLHEVENHRLLVPTAGGPIGSPKGCFLTRPCSKRENQTGGRLGDVCPGPRDGRVVEIGSLVEKLLDFGAHADVQDPDVDTDAHSGHGSNLRLEPGWGAASGLEFGRAASRKEEWHNMRGGARRDDLIERDSPHRGGDGQRRRRTRREGRRRKERAVVARSDLELKGFPGVEMEAHSEKKADGIWREFACQGAAGA